MPPLGWTKKEAEKRGELGKGRPRAVELRDSVAALAPFEFAEEGEEEVADDESPDSSGAGKAPAHPSEVDAAVSAGAGASTAPQGEPSEPSAAPADAAPPMRPKIWLRLPSGGGIQLCGSLRKFCQQQGLEYEGVVSVLNGQADDYKGWRGGFGPLPPAPAVPTAEPPVLYKARLAAHPYFRAVNAGCAANASTDVVREMEITRKLGLRPPGSAADKPALEVMRFEPPAPVG
eukprot:Transcript_12214.p2 GENE.Transcript_12214~~Transcript_12214.p2  ORF type:complete len:232 (-),score=53.71 Transcript_12214:75-770(-)